MHNTSKKTQQDYFLYYHLGVIVETLNDLWGSAELLDK